jgi:ubiquinone/menaquinone biosynthesis C-methylase UbiE
MTDVKFASTIQPHIGARMELLQKWIPPGAKRFLDLGCAFGYISACIDSPTRQIFGIDPSLPYVKEAHQTYPAIPFASAIAEALPFKNDSVDCIVMTEVLEHVVDDRQALQEVHRVLVPGGMLLLTVPHAGPLSFLDIDNLLYFFPGAHRYLYRLRWGNCAGFIPKNREHRHYSVAKIKELLGGQFVLEETFLSGFVALALATLFRNFTRGRVKFFLHSIMDWDYRRKYGALATNLAMRIRKAELAENR